MSLARGDTGEIRDFHSKASGLARNLRDASGRTGRIWQQTPTAIQTPGKQRPGGTPYSLRRMTGDTHRTGGRDGKHGSSSAPGPSSSRHHHASKRRRLDHLQENKKNVSKFFDDDGSGNQHFQAIPSTSTSSHPSCATADAIVIDGEDDSAATNDDLHEPIVLETSSPDPMDLISPDVSYAFDQKKPSPLQQLSSTLEEMRKPPQDGESTLRVRHVLKQAEAPSSKSASHLDSDGSRVQRARALPTLSESKLTAQVGVSSEGNNVQTKVALYEQNKQVSPHIDLKLKATMRRSRKSVMKPKQPRRDVLALPIQHMDPDATRPSGFVSGSKHSKGKATENIVSVHLPLKEWSIGAAIPPQEITSEPLVNLIWEPGVLKVREANGSISFELQVKRGSVDSVKYVDIKRTTISEPLIQIHPSVMASAQNRTTYRFMPGSSYSDGLLTFKFDTTASGWDGGVYVGVVQKLVDALVSKDDKSILDGPAARALWEAVTRVQEDRSIMSDPESMVLDMPKENSPKPPSRPRARLKPRTDATATAEIFVRRSARLSGSEQKRFSPRPDPDEVILGYRSGTGSLNITNGDVSRLKPGEFLNDTLIEFGLKLWLADLQETNPELASQVHVFNSFFYKKLSTKIPEEGYNSVRKWTSKFDLFRKKYIIVPINENLHWYLAIIYFPEYTLLPRPVQKTSLQPRRSTRHLRVISDSPNAQQPELALGQLLPPDPDPPPNGQVDRTAASEYIVPESPRTDDQKDEIDVERMVESACTPVDPTAMQVDGQEEGSIANTESQVTHCLDPPLPMYHQSISLSHQARLSSLDPQDDGTERLDHPALTLTGGSEGDTTRTSGISPSNFYGTRRPEQGNSSPQLIPTETSAVPEIEIEEDETMGNPESEQEEATKQPRTSIFTFDSLASKHPQAVKRLSRYLLMEAHDKKQLAEDMLTEPKGMQAIVPAQPNYCDCGIYLLHFAKTFMKDPKLSADIIRNRSSPQKGRRVPHEHWDGASAGSYREELAARIYSMSEEWKKQRGEQDSGMKYQADGTAPPEQPHGDPTPTASLKAEDDSDSDIEVLGSPQKATPSTAPRRDSSGLVEPRKKGPAARVR